MGRDNLQLRNLLRVPNLAFQAADGFLREPHKLCRSRASSGLPAAYLADG